jgi:hypothetical protein
MRRIVPSEVVPFIEVRFPWIKEQNAHPHFKPGEARALVQLVEGVPDELLTLAPEEFAELTVSVAILDVSSREQAARNLSSSERAAIRSLHRLLQKCPDDFPAAGTVEPAFITDPDLRADLHRDIGEVNRALQNKEWKSATVLTGSLVEAMLLWALQNKKTLLDLQAVATSGKAVNSLSALETWGLADLIPLARGANLISESTKNIATECKNFRNLIHPGRAARQGMKCNRSTALNGASAVEAVIDDLR